MAKVTSKFQITIPKALADQLQIREGDEIEWSAAGDSLRVRRIQRYKAPAARIEARLKMFDAATRRQRRAPKGARGRDRGWTREELYHRGTR